MLSGGALYQGSLHVTRWHQNTAQARSEEAQRYRNLAQDLDDYASGRKRAVGFLDPTRAGVIGRSSGTRILTPPVPPLAGLIHGQSDLFPSRYRITTDQPIALMPNPELQNPAHLATGRFDFAVVLLWLYPLLILSFTYDCVASERESGTWRLALAQGIAPTRLALRKLLPRAILPLVLCLTVTLIGAWLTGAEEPIRLAASCLAILLYGLFWVAISLTVQTLPLTPAACALANGAVWLALAVILPQSAHTAAAYLHPIPSRVELLEAIQAATQEANQQGGLLLARFLDDAPDLDPSDPLARATAVQAEIDRLIQPVLLRYQRFQNLQTAAVEQLRPVSPTLILEGALQDLAGTSQHQRLRFQNRASQFQLRWAAYFRPLTLSQARFQRADLDRLPRPLPDPEPPGEPLRRQIHALVYLAAATTALLAISLLRLR